MARFNRQGQFTAAHHHGRRGIAPDRLRPVLAECSEKLRGRDIQFTVADFEEIRSRRRDFLYLDLPHEASAYYGRVDHGQLFRWLERQRARYVLAMNGFAGDGDRRFAVPEWLYDEHVQMDVGGSLERQTDDGEPPFVTDSLYVRREA